MSTCIHAEHVSLVVEVAAYFKDDNILFLVMRSCASFVAVAGHTGAIHEASILLHEFDKGEENGANDCDDS